MRTPSSWNDLLKPSDAVKGKLTMLATDRWLLGAAFLANGWSVNESNPQHITQVFDPQLLQRARDEARSPDAGREAVER